jgi:hypothetical protein
MNLDDAQKQKIAAWLEEGLKLFDIQKRIEAEFGLRMTYMDVRFLLDDLKLKPKEKEPAAPPVPEIGQAAAGAKAAVPGSAVSPQSDLDDDEAQPLPAGAGNIAVTVDQLARPGAVVSGNVTFSDGNSAQWYLDQMGRLGLAAKQQGYRPSPPDLAAFQAELQNQLAKLGY